MKYIILFCVIGNSLFITAQEAYLNSKVLPVQQKGNINLDPKFFDGQWMSVDSSTCDLQIKYANKEVKFFYTNDIVYSFTNFTNLKYPTIMGTYAHWPPEYCFITVVDKKTIEVEYFQMAVSFTNKKLYRKR
jgi:hypothetical protein